MRFYTLSLPRTRSMWLSFLFRGAGVWCAHELLTSGQEFPDGLKVGGSCETNPLMEYDFGESRVVIVSRNPDDIIKSAVKQFDVTHDFATRYVDLCLEELSAKEIKHSFVFNYDDFADAVAIKEMCDWLMPIDVSLDWITYMQQCNIQTTNTSVRDRVPADVEARLCA